MSDPRNADSSLDLLEARLGCQWAAIQKARTDTTRRRSELGNLFRSRNRGLVRSLLLQRRISSYSTPRKTGSCSAHLPVVGSRRTFRAVREQPAQPRHTNGDETHSL